MEIERGFEGIELLLKNKLDRGFFGFGLRHCELLARESQMILTY